MGSLKLKTKQFCDSKFKQFSDSGIADIHSRVPADKGNATVLLSHEQYHSKISEHISSGPYTLLQRDPTSSLPGKVDRILKKLLKEG